MNMKLFVAILLLFGPMAAGAVPLSYDESTDGDISTTSIGPIFDFDIGQNMVIGSLTASDSVNDFDQFRFNIPVGASLISVNYEYGNINLLPNTAVLSATFSIRDFATGNGCLLTPTVNLPSAGPGSTLYSSCSNFLAFPFEGDGWVWSHSTGHTSGGGGSWDYKLTFNVTGNTVPEPATLALMGLGIAGLGFARRKKA